MSTLILSAQNVDIYAGDGLDPFARTGATSWAQLQRAGAEGVIIGHSEVGDSLAVVRAKLQSVSELGNHSRSTLLVGETWDEFAGQTPESVAQIIEQKVRELLVGIPSEALDLLVLGYEPKWGSRGSGRDDQPPPTPELISLCAGRMKGVLSELGAPEVPVIYGGRSTPERTEIILDDSHVDGLILGSACNTLQKTLEIASAMTRSMGDRHKVLHANFKAYDLVDSYEAYIEALLGLDASFLIYLSPPHTDIMQVRSILDRIG